MEYSATEDSTTQTFTSKKPQGLSPKVDKYYQEFQKYFSNFGSFSENRESLQIFIKLFLMTFVIFALCSDSSSFKSYSGKTFQSTFNISRVISFNHNYLSKSYIWYTLHFHIFLNDTTLSTVFRLMICENGNCTVSPQPIRAIFNADLLQSTTIYSERYFTHSSPKITEIYLLNITDEIGYRIEAIPPNDILIICVSALKIIISFSLLITLTNFVCALKRSTLRRAFDTPMVLFIISSILYNNPFFIYQILDPNRFIYHFFVTFLSSFYLFFLIFYSMTSIERFTIVFSPVYFNPMTQRFFMSSSLMVLWMMSRYSIFEFDSQSSIILMIMFCAEFSYVLYSVLKHLISNQVHRKMLSSNKQIQILTFILVLMALSLLSALVHHYLRFGTELLIFELFESWINSVIITTLVTVQWPNQELIDGLVMIPTTTASTTKTAMSYSIKEKNESNSFDDEDDELNAFFQMQDRAMMNE